MIVLLNFVGMKKVKTVFVGSGLATPIFRLCIGGKEDKMLNKKDRNCEKGNRRCTTLIC